MNLDLKIDVPQARDNDDATRVGQTIINVINDMLRAQGKPELGKEVFEASWSQP